jgi:transcriptional regulator with XRE-family HTH domain
MSTPIYRFSGALYRAERERQGLSREDVAIRYGCSVSLVTAVELDRHVISVVKAARFAAAIGRRVDDFIVADGDPVPA